MNSVSPMISPGYFEFAYMQLHRVQHEYRRSYEIQQEKDETCKPLDIFKPNYLKPKLSDPRCLPLDYIDTNSEALGWLVTINFMVITGFVAIISCLDYYDK